MRRRRHRVIIASGDACKTETTNQIEHLIPLLEAPGRTVEVALVGDGERLRPLRRQARVFVADRFRTSGLGGLARAVGLTGLAGRYKSWRVHRWSERAMAATWIIVDPRACSFVRHASTPPQMVIGALLTPGSHHKDLEAPDREVLAAAALWIAADEAQVEELTASVDVPVQFVGDLYLPDHLHPDRHPLPPDDPAGAPIVISDAAHLWEQVSHTVEVIAGVQAERPDVPIHWLVAPGEDEWLARHDLARLGLAPDAPVRIVRRTGPFPPVRPLLLVRASYAATDPDLAVALAFNGIPTVGFDLGDLPVDAGTAAAPFAVEELVRQVIDLLDDDRRREAGDQLHRAIRGWHDPLERLAPVLDLLADRDARP